jgi:uncharacterized protein YprB with RNaseH-like and TPR domain
MTTAIDLYTVDPYCILDLETSGLSPDNHFITCIGILEDIGIRQFSAPARLFREDPKRAEHFLLENFLAHMESTPETITFITFNGAKFDFPFIATRLIKQQLEESLSVSILDEHNIDLSVFIRNLMQRYTSKDDACRKFCNLYVPRKSEGIFLSRIYSQQVVTDDEHTEMLQHNAVDLGITHRLWLGLQRFPDFQQWLTNDKKE